MNKNKKKEFLLELAKEIKPDGYRCFLHESELTDICTMSVITPNNSWLIVQPNCYWGWDITYEYVPSMDFGTGCGYNADPLFEITTETLKQVEQYGKHYGYMGWKKVFNLYDGGSHRENVWRSPKHYTDGYKAMKEHGLKWKQEYVEI